MDRVKALLRQDRYGSTENGEPTTFLPVIADVKSEHWHKKPPQEPGVYILWEVYDIEHENTKALQIVEVFHGGEAAPRLYSQLGSKVFIATEGTRAMWYGPIDRPK